MRPQAVEHVGALTDERMEESLAHVVTAASYLEVGQRLRNEGALSAAVVAHNKAQVCAHPEPSCVLSLSRSFMLMVST
jgi:hypothetical protein